MPLEDLIATPPLPPLPNINTRTSFLSHDSNDNPQQPSAFLPAQNTSDNQRQIMADVESSTDDGKKGGKSRRELPAGAVATLKTWLLSPEHFTHPYPTPQDQIMLMQKTGIDKKQLKNWFTNARRRIWKPMLKKQLEQGKIQQTGSGGVVTMNAPVMMMNAPAPGTEFAPGPSADHSQAVQQNYQNVVQQPQPQYGNPGYVQQQQQQQPPPVPNQFGATNYYPQGEQRQYNQNDSMLPSNSIGSLPGASSGSNLNKTDSHAVLMELFARDQDLVRRQASKERGTATNGEQSQSDGNMNQLQLGSQHPMSSKIAGGSSTLNKLGSVPSMSSWPRFSSVSSLNNLGTMTGVKSITNMSGADLVSQGSLNRNGNLAQVKSIENMGRADSYAFLEVFFDNPGGSSQSQRGIKREREEDDNVGLSLDGDEGNSPAVGPGTTLEHTMGSSGAPVPAPLPADGQDKEGLKRAYDDALAARGLISVSRSCEKLTDLALPAKMQKTISQEYLKSMTGSSTTFTTFSFNPQPAPAPGPIQAPLLIAPILPPPVHPAMQNVLTQNGINAPIASVLPPSIHPAMQNMLTQNGINGNDSVEVPATTKCAICNQTNVDTQLRPCGHLFHGTCVKGSMQNSSGGSPCCPIDGEPMISCILLVPEEK